MEIKTKTLKNAPQERLAISHEMNSVVLLYVPDKSKPEHYHIQLSLNEALKMAIQIVQYAMK